ncbi:MAG: intradiol ring-cleavage dioxygenase [Pseudomonadota bacterium]
MHTETPAPLNTHLVRDLDTWVEKLSDRRKALRWLGMAALSPALAACGGGADAEAATATGSTTTTTTPTTTTTTTTTTPTTASGTCSVIPSETNGPYPGDGSNSNASGVANALLLSGIVRRDIRSSIVTSSNSAAGVPLTVTLTLVNTKNSCAQLSGYAVYLWHCDRVGLYSMYSTGVTNENYLRGVQVTDANGQVTFTTIFPGCYAGRMPHMHFEVYASLAAATTTPASDQVRTSQIAFPTAVCDAVYATSGYGASIRNLASINFASDNVFSDGYSTQLATVTGDASAGYVATLQVGIAA